MDETTKARFAAEAKALRAYYFFELQRSFGHIPLIVDLLLPTEIYNVEQATPEAVYAQIETDLTEAFAVLPATVPAAEAGRWNKGIVQALLGKVYLYEGKNAEAAAQFAEVNGAPGGTSQYGYHLLTNYSDLWIPANKFNAESILESPHTNKSESSWGTGAREATKVTLWHR
ncbi:RagB/SusD family nutrient uptake outer membrane protein [Flavobacterium sp. 3HN19-14]|uniref:RagB/SusD family nutrient uptake outer membrane protein n=1 Tax=Flavobacterium sp. 3HN19-14 TaxID=3448133 RepID=UPI003EE0B244